MRNTQAKYSNWAIDKLKFPLIVPPQFLDPKGKSRIYNKSNSRRSVLEALRKPQPAFRG